MAKVELEGVRKVYDNGHVAVQKASFIIEDGELVVLVGPSGCGKSTTLRMLAGLEHVTEGTIRIGGHAVNEVPPKDRDIAMVFQNYALYPHMTVFDNMAFGLKLRKFPKQEIKTRVHQAAEILGIERILDRKPKQLSGGQRQRVAVGRAIVRKPQVFLFDEPLSNLDAKLRVQMRTEIAKLHRRLGATMVYVTHDQVEAMTMGERIVVMRDGHIQQIDTPLHLYNYPVNKFVAGFIGSPSMNFIQGKIKEEINIYFKGQMNNLEIMLDADNSTVLQDYIGREVFLGIRPEDLYIYGSSDVQNSDIKIEMMLDVLEPMGNEIFVYARLGDAMVVARVAPQPLPKPGENIKIAIDKSKLHFFDLETEQAIGLKETESLAI